MVKYTKYIKSIMMESTHLDFFSQMMLLRDYQFVQHNLNKNIYYSRNKRIANTMRKFIVLLMYK